MEKRHRQLLVQRSPAELQPKPLIVLDIPDENAFMESALIDILRVRLMPHLEHVA